MSEDMICCDDVKKDCWERECIECEIPAVERNNYFCGKLMVERDFWCDQNYHIGKQRLHNRLAHGWGTLCGLKVVKHHNPKCQDKYVVLEPGVALDCCGREIQVREKEYIDLPAIEDERVTLGRRTNEFMEILKSASPKIKAADKEKIKAGFEKALEAIEARPINVKTAAKKITAFVAKIATDIKKEKFESDIGEWFRNELTLYVAIRYRECYTEAVPSLFNECGCDDKCEPNRIRETFEVNILTANALRRQLKRYDEGGTPLKDGSCDAIYKTVVKECPECDECGGEKWVVLASIEDYTSGDSVIDLPEGVNVGVQEAFIDNFTYRRLVPSTDKIYEIVRCLLKNGGGAGPQGDPGPQGDLGPQGDPGPPGKDAIGLDPKLPKVIKVDPSHDADIELPRFKGITIKFSEPMDTNTINENTFVVSVKIPDGGTGDYSTTQIMGTFDFSGSANNEIKFMPSDKFIDNLDKLLEQFKAATCNYILKGDFILSKKGIPLDGDHLTRDPNTGHPQSGLPSGDWIPGGNFESWFKISKGQ